MVVVIYRVKPVISFLLKRYKENSRIGCSQKKKDALASNHIHFNKCVISNILVMFGSKQIQKKCVDSIVVLTKMAYFYDRRGSSNIQNTISYSTTTRKTI